MIAPLLLAFPVAAFDVTWTAPKVYVEGKPYKAHVTIHVTGKAEIPTWMFEPGAFSIDGKPVEERKNKDKIDADKGAELQLHLDLGPAIAASKGFGKKDFKLTFTGSSDSKPVDVRVFAPAAKGLDFMDDKKMPAADLADYFVVLDTNRGTMVLEFWPDVAPGHVRNYLDLAYSGFYDDTLFHRVGPGFMIQGGDPNSKDASKQAEWGTGSGPRMLKHEFSSKKHVRGVLSMARGGGRTPQEDEKFWDSASSQFFIMDGPNPGLDGKYSAFGMLVDGVDVLEQIAKSPGKNVDAATFRPNEPQKLLSATVVRAPAKK